MVSPIFDAKNRTILEVTRDNSFLENIIRNSEEEMRTFGEINGIPDNETVEFLIQSENQVLEANAIISKYEDLVQQTTEWDSGNAVDDRKLIDEAFQGNAEWIFEKKEGVRIVYSSLYKAFSRVLEAMADQFSLTAKVNNQEMLFALAEQYAAIFGQPKNGFQDLRNKHLERYSRFVAQVKDIDSSLDLSYGPETTKEELINLRKNMEDTVSAYKQAEKSHRPLLGNRKIYSCQDRIDNLTKLERELSYIIDNYESIVSLKNSMDSNIAQINCYASQLPNLGTAKKDIETLAVIKEYSAWQAFFPDSDTVRTILGDKFLEYKNGLARLKKDAQSKIQETREKLKAEAGSFPAEPTILAEIHPYNLGIEAAIPKIRDCSERFQILGQSDLYFDNQVKNLSGLKDKYQGIEKLASNIAAEYPAIRELTSETAALSTDIQTHGIDIPRIQRIRQSEREYLERKDKYKQKSNTFLADRVAQYDSLARGLEAEVLKANDAALRSADLMYDQIKDNPTDELKNNLMRVYSALGNNDGVNRVKALLIRLANHENKDVSQPLTVNPETQPKAPFHIGNYLRQFQPDNEEYGTWTDILLGKKYADLMDRIDHIERRVRTKINAGRYEPSKKNIDYISHIRYAIDQFAQNGYLGEVIRDFDHRQEKVRVTLDLLDQFITISKDAVTVPN